MPTKSQTRTQARSRRNQNSNKDKSIITTPRERVFSAHVILQANTRSSFGGS